MTSAKEGATQISLEKQQKERPMKILLIDDDPDLLGFLELMVKEYARKETICVTSCNEAVGKVESDSEIGIIFLDMHGCGDRSELCCKAMTRGIRVIFCTGDYVNSKCFTEVLLKPFNGNDLEALLSK